jgi:hypothetical protein
MQPSTTTAAPLPHAAVSYIAVTRVMHVAFAENIDYAVLTGD